MKLGTSSPRPVTPDTGPMKKMYDIIFYHFSSTNIKKKRYYYKFYFSICRTIKPVMKKMEEDGKREPSPELAKISALVTRPPKQKSTSKKAEEGTYIGNPALQTSFSTDFSSVTKSKKSSLKSIYANESPTYYDPIVKKINDPLPPQRPAFYFVSTFVLTKSRISCLLNKIHFCFLKFFKNIFEKNKLQ